MAIDVKGGSYTIMLKAMAANFQDIDKLQPGEAKNAAKAGRIRAASRRTNTTASDLEKEARDLMIQLSAPPDTTREGKRLMTSEKEGLVGLSNQFKQQQMTFSDKYNSLEKKREEILARVNEISKQPSSKDITQLMQEVMMYQQEMGVLRKNLAEFNKTVRDRANSVIQGVLKTPQEQETPRPGQS